MVRDWEIDLRVWGRAPGPTEQGKMESTEAWIREAIKASPALASRDIDIRAQGSYKNLSHIPRESDVDIRVVLKEVAYYDFEFVDPNATTEAMFQRYGISPVAYTFDEFRNDVGAALVARFGGAPAVDPGDKAFRIRETRYQVDADVVPAFVHKRYNKIGDPDEGVEFVTRKGRYIINWPEQQFRNGIDKNQATGERYKAMVRALKNLRAEMQDQGNASAEPMSSFLIECLVFNVDNDRFGHTTYYDDMKEVLRLIYHATTSDENCAKWVEESRLKYLFHPVQPWTRAQANAFVLAAWNYVGYAD